MNKPDSVWGKYIRKQTPVNFNALLSAIKFYFRENLYALTPDESLLLEYSLRIEARLKDKSLPARLVVFLSHFILKNLIIKIYLVLLITILVCLLLRFKDNNLLLHWGVVTAFCTLSLKVFLTYRIAIDFNLAYNIVNRVRDFTRLSKYYPFQILGMELLIIAMLAWKATDYYARGFRYEYKTALKILHSMLFILSILCLCVHSYICIGATADNNNIAVGLSKTLLLIQWIGLGHASLLLVATVMKFIISLYVLGLD